jgi:branched-chain amino acid transport system permease protein
MATEFKSKILKFINELLLFVFLIVLWFICPSFSSYALHVGIISLYYVLMSSSWNWIAGSTGQSTYSHAAFASLGAYMSALLGIQLGGSLVFSIAFAFGLGVFLGSALGVLCLRLTGTYLALVTLAFSEVVRLIITNEDQWTRGALGLQVPPLFEDFSKVSAMRLFLVVNVFVLALLLCFRKSRWGLWFRSIMADEVAAASLGVNTRFYRTFAFSISSGIASLSGALYGHYLGLISPDLGSLSQMFLILAMTLLGGLGTFWGPVIGAIILEVFSEQFRVFGEHHVLVFGVVTLLMYRFRSEGLVSWFKIKGTII